MSMRALLVATRDHLMTVTPHGILPTATVDTGIGAKGVSIVPNGRPFAMSCAIFIGLYPASWRNNSTEGLDEDYTVNATVSARINGLPAECWNEVILGLLETTEKMRATLHLNYDVLHRANALIAAAANAIKTNSGVDTVTGFEEPLFFQNAGPIEIKGGEWYYSLTKERYAAFTQTSTYVARRTQRAENQT